VKYFATLLALSLGALTLRPDDNVPLGRPHDRFIWGVGTHLAGRADGAERLDFVREVGGTSLRDDLFWSRVETRLGHFELPTPWQRFVEGASARGISPLFILDYGNPVRNIERPYDAEQLAAFTQYARFVAGSLGRSVPLYEVWNEWPMKTEHDVKAYVRLLRATYPVLKRAAPHARVLGGGFGVRGVEALRQFMKLGGAKYVDGISVHPYVQCEHRAGPEGFMDLLMSMVRITASAPNKPLYITEIGWPTHTARCGIDEREAGRYLAAAYLVARCTPRVAGLWWYDLADDGPKRDDAEHNFGLFHEDFTPKAAASVAKAIGGVHARLRCVRPIRSALSDARFALGREVYDFDHALSLLTEPVSEATP
jgi:polysaccharide biosynthesis protein PslG